MYENIVAKKRDPALLEYGERNLFRANIYPVSPEEQMRVVTEYSQICTYDSGNVTFNYPLCTGGKEQKIGNFLMYIKIKDQRPVKNIVSTSHGAATVKLKSEHNGVVYYRLNNFTPDKDFSIKYEIQSTELKTSFLTYRPENQDGYFLMMVAPQEETSANDIIKKDMIFVFDKSSSMSGMKIQQSKEALKYCIKNLAPDDRFNIITFSKNIEKYSKNLLPASDENILKAIEHIEKLESEGYTNLNDALVTAMKMFEHNSNQKTIIFLTDGIPTEGEKEISKIVKNVRKANMHNVRLFTFGVGDDVDDYLLLKLATDGHGAEQHVRTSESIETKISDFYGKISKPLLINLKLDFGKIKTAYTYPAILPDVFKGSQLIIAGRYKNSGKENVILRGEINGKPVSYNYNVDFPKKETHSNFIAPIWAKYRVDWALDYIKLNGEDDNLKKEIIKLSKTYMFITPYTSFFAAPKEEIDAANNQSSSNSSPSYSSGGDPLIKVLPPEGTRKIIALFPWGEAKSLKQDKNTGYWLCRFIIPKNTEHGTYNVSIIITRENGAKEKLVLSFQADKLPPEGHGTGNIAKTSDGWNVNIWVEATEDTYRADAVLPDGKMMKLDFSKNNKKWEGHFTLNKDISENSIMVPVVLYDRGHNIVTVEVEVKLNNDN